MINDDGQTVASSAYIQWFKLRFDSLHFKALYLSRIFSKQPLVSFNGKIGFFSLWK